MTNNNAYKNLLANLPSTMYFHASTWIEEDKIQTTDLGLGDTTEYPLFD